MKLKKWTLLRTCLLSLVLVFGMVALTACSSSGDGSGEDASQDTVDVQDTAEPTQQQKAAEIVSNMTLEQKVGQMFLVTPEELTGVDTVIQAGSKTEEALKQYPVGGLVYFKKNLESPDQTRTMISNSQSYSQEASGLPLFIGVDEEGGTVVRIADNSGFGIENVGNMSAIGATGDTDKAKQAAVTIGNYLSDYGFNLNFAPDSDICGDPASDVMAKRSFGTDANTVAEMVKAQVEGYSSTGIMSCAKHFPGIGGVVGDSHNETIVSEKTLDQLRETNLVPFQAAIEADVPFVMVGHLSLPNIMGDNRPASISSQIITDLLRNELGYDGIVITDSLSMQALKEYCSDDQVGVAAIQAGADIALMPEDFPAAYQGVIDAVNNGTITEDRIDESVTRIVLAKMNYLGAE